MGTTQTGPGNQRLPVLSDAPFWRPSLAVSQRLREGTERTTAPPASDCRRISRCPRPTPDIPCADTAPFPGVARIHPTHGSHTHRNEPGRATIFPIGMILIGAPGLS
ncbi:Uncharacterised protein [Mycobacteroides abscessus subsp. abscessus]|uniref:Uncharacterized protein n=1 Tax=Mycobacteroides abscessus subsp. abscessus TaxID=1185650 RepID=A0AB74FBJ9_9MYCO|nr:hypothetical protein [Mycobacteroides abscessus]SHP32427.1 Uncharacterised protein [Mycobacteroides abscessus subsp. abscessus]MBE5413603.1 hypothetical protein [Mycobacteroides abscessus]MBE5424485.1 hypothetical protein [Mycobacteroides abscessus]MBE5477310.1 hypothetical protein [Mycobacteroides abscessus]